MDGWIKIGTKLETNKFDSQVAELERKIAREEEKSEIKLKAKIQAEDELKRHKQAVFEIEQEYDKLSQKVEHLNSIIEKQAQGISLTPQDFTDLQDYDQIVAQADKMGASLDRAYSKTAQLTNKAERMAVAYNDVNSKVSSYKRKIESINLKRQTADLNSIQSSIGKVGKGIEGAIKKTARLALGVFGIRSAFLALRRASSDLASYDKQYAANLEYIRYVLTQMLAPILRYIVGLAYKLLQIIGYIAKAWFGVNLFANASAESFKKMKQNAEGTTKSAKELKKTLTGFDEMNILSGGEIGASTASSGITMPEFDISEMQGEVPDWLKWIADNKDLVISALGGIAAAILAIKLGLGGIEALGIGLILGGAVYLVQQLVSYLGKLDGSLANNGTSWFDFGKIIEAVGVIILGIAAVVGSVATAIVGAIVFVAGIFVKYWDNIKGFLQSGIDWLNSKTDWIRTNFGELGLWIKEIFVGVIEIVMNLFEGLFRAIKGIFDGILLIFKGKFGEGIVSILKGIVNLVIGILNALISALNAVLYPIRAIISGISHLVGGNWSIDQVKIPHIPYLATGAILNNPGKGVPVGGALAGEAGQEGIIPLTDSQAMETLGEAIGRYITINANITNNMNGRVISRQLQKIQGNKDFAYNQ